MLTERLQARCTSAKVLGTAWAEGYQLIFNKDSLDGSSKGNLMHELSAPSRAHGVLFSIALDDLDKLHSCEGHPNHYRYVEGFRVIKSNDHQEISVSTYLACDDKIVERKFPYDWYLDLVIAGAVQHGFPPDYIARLREQKSRADPDPQRASGVEARKLLE